MSLFGDLPEGKNAPSGSSVPQSWAAPQLQPKMQPKKAQQVAFAPASVLARAAGRGAGRWAEEDATWSTLCRLPCSAMPRHVARVVTAWIYRFLLRASVEVLNGLNISEICLVKASP
jgi:hypothetical protein